MSTTREVNDDVWRFWYITQKFSPENHITKNNSNRKLSSLAITGNGNYDKLLLNTDLSGLQVLLWTGETSLLSLPSELKLKYLHIKRFQKGFNDAILVPGVKFINTLHIEVPNFFYFQYIKISSGVENFIVSLSSENPTANYNSLYINHKTLRCSVTSLEIICDPPPFSDEYQYYI